MFNHMLVPLDSGQPPPGCSRDRWGSAAESVRQFGCHPHASSVDVFVSRRRSLIDRKDWVRWANTRCDDLGGGHPGHGTGLSPV